MTFFLGRRNNTERRKIYLATSQEMNKQATERAKGNSAFKIFRLLCMKYSEDQSPHRLIELDQLKSRPDPVTPAILDQDPVFMMKNLKKDIHRIYFISFCGKNEISLLRTA